MTGKPSSVSTFINRSICLYFPAKTTIPNYTNIQFSSHPGATGEVPYSQR
jgi:hypothetical protein